MPGKNDACRGRAQLLKCWLNPQRHGSAGTSELAFLGVGTHSGCSKWRVSVNGGTPKSSILIGFSLINHPFWGFPIYGNPPTIAAPRPCDPDVTNSMESGVLADWGYRFRQVELYNHQVGRWSLVERLMLFVCFDHWIGLRENLHRKPMGFLPSNIGLSCKFSHHPIL